MNNRPILMFDSGIGGLTVLREARVLMPDRRFVYVADDAAFPYGNWEEEALSARIVELCGSLIARHDPEIFVIPCNTASTLVLAELRAAYPGTPFVGTVPAIKPACAASKSKMISVLGTEATVRREYTRRLIADFAGACAVTLVGSARLAAFAEAELNGAPVPDAAIATEIAPCFVDDGTRRTDTVVLACTHFPLLIARLRALSPWPVAFLDPATAIARRVVGLLGKAPADAAGGVAQMALTSGRAPSPALAAALPGFGFRRPVVDTPALPA
jgi:glutamate racemase